MLCHFSSLIGTASLSGLDSGIDLVMPILLHLLSHVSLRGLFCNLWQISGAYGTTADLQKFISSISNVADGWLAILQVEPFNGRAVDDLCLK